MHAKTSDDPRMYSNLIFEIWSMQELIRRMAWSWIFLNLN